jgi:glutamate-1-semialdehyde 2,1-aminomutase
MSSGSASQALAERAGRVIPGGVNSPARAFRGVGGTPIYIKEARGSRVFDEDGAEYIDFVNGWGALLHGHAPPFIVQAIEQSQRSGIGCGVPTRAEVEFAERLVRMLRWPEQVRLMNSGTEAVMTAVRLARGATGRAGLVKLIGGYHGHSDAMLVAGTESGEGTPRPGSGLTAGVAADVWMAPYNNASALERVLSANSGRIAAVIIEPVAANMGVVLPAKGFLQDVRRLCDRAGVILIFDEVVTGLRVARGGATEWSGVAPDLATYGKVIGGGMPMGAVAGGRRLMSQLAPSGSVVHAGTFAGHPASTAAGLAVLDEIERTPSTYERLDERGAALESGVVAAISSYGYPCTFARAGSMWTLFCASGVVTDWSSASQASTGTFGRFFHAMLARGIHLAPSQHEANFISTAHSEADIDRTVASVVAALHEVYGRVR